MTTLTICQGMTPLHFAADRGSEKFVNYLIDNGADLNSQDNDGQTPLMLAGICEHEVNKAI